MNDGQTIETLKNRAEFVTLNRKGRKWSAHGLVLQAIKNDLGKTRIGYTVTKKTEKSAVKRNRIKRRLRAVASEIITAHAVEGHDYVLIGIQASAIRPYTALCNDLKWCLEKLGCLKP
ncbi:MAG: ribonuclease P protein component [Alphaproteobacteria bacterium]